MLIKIRYLHRTTHDPKTYPRQNALDKIKLIASAPDFEGVVRQEDYIMAPAKAPRRQRNLRKKPKNIYECDSDFSVVDSN
jgi:hypothetical protein